jgi:hypothetical protein
MADKKTKDSEMESIAPINNHENDYDENDDDDHRFIDEYYLCVMGPQKSSQQFCTQFSKCILHFNQTIDKVQLECHDNRPRIPYMRGYHRKYQESKKSVHKVIYLKNQFICSHEDQYVMYRIDTGFVHWCCRTYVHILRSDDIFIFLYSHFHTYMFLYFTSFIFTF